MNETMMKAIVRNTILRIASEEPVTIVSNAAINQPYLVDMISQFHASDRKKEV